MASPFLNNFLTALPVNEFARIASDLSVVAIHAGQVIQRRGEPWRNVYFLGRNLCSLTMMSADGSTAEVASVGSEGFVGVESFLGVRTAFSDVTMHIAGDGIATVMSVEAFRRELDRRDVFYAQASESVGRFIEGLSASVACNARHSVEERCGRWLLEAENRLGSRELPVTHELLAHLLGVRRPTVSLALQQFQRVGIISTARGRIQIADHGGLARRACDCYERNRLLEHRPAPVVSQPQEPVAAL